MVHISCHLESKVCDPLGRTSELIQETDSILRARNDLIEQVLRAAYKHIEGFSFTDRNVCQNADDGWVCDPCVYGSYIRSMKAHNLWPEVSPSSVAISVTQLVRTLQGLHVVVCPGHGFLRGYVINESRGNYCTPQQELHERLEELISIKASPVFEAHKHRLDLQRVRIRECYTHE